ncbi:hypothetical protein Tco_0775320 [Tanacetum coccineum]
MDAEDRFNKVIEKVSHVDKLNLRNLEECKKDGYELFGNRFMTTAIEHLFNEDLEYLKSGNKDLKGRKYVLSITKRHAAEYKIRWIEEDIGRLFRNTFVEYDMDDMLGIHHWPKMKKLSCRGKRVVVTNGKVYSDLKITFVDEVKVDLLFDYRFLESITMTRVDKKKYTFKESDFSRLNLNDIEEISVIIKKIVEDVQLGVESYQKSLNIIKPKTRIPNIKQYPTYTMCPKPFGVVYEGRGELKKFMRSNEVFKFCDETLISSFSSNQKHAVCIQTRIHDIISEAVQIPFGNETLTVRVKEFHGEIDSLFNWFKVDSSIADDDLDTVFDEENRSSDEECDKVGDQNSDNEVKILATNSNPAINLSDNKSDTHSEEGSTSTPALQVNDKSIVSDTSDDDSDKFDQPPNNKSKLMYDSSVSSSGPIP